ncbi:hydantoinase B/oxoprolinase family protein [Raineyella sp.]|uniref:hydantoinase B/oxoprolinase family protein n=1 Tax=Raineyella sp. TaxID=1911550 RepID=UPI003A521A6B
MVWESRVTSGQQGNPTRPHHSACTVTPPRRRRRSLSPRGPRKLPRAAAGARNPAGSGGAGRWRGFDGGVRRIQFTKAMTVSTLSGHRRVAPYGMGGVVAAAVVVGRHTERGGVGCGLDGVRVGELAVPHGHCDERPGTAGPASSRKRSAGCGASRPRPADAGGDP